MPIDQLTYEQADTVVDLWQRGDCYWLPTTAQETVLNKNQKSQNDLEASTKTHLRWDNREL